MNTEGSGLFETIIDREKLMQHKTCAACGRPFTLGDPVVLARGPWEAPVRLIHKNEAVFDDKSSTYVERNYLQTNHTI